MVVGRFLKLALVLVVDIAIAGGIYLGPIVVAPLHSRPHTLLSRYHACPFVICLTLLLTTDGDFGHIKKILKRVRFATPADFITRVIPAVWEARKQRNTQPQYGNNACARGHTQWP